MGYKGFYKMRTSYIALFLLVPLVSCTAQKKDDTPASTAPQQPVFIAPSSIPRPILDRLNADKDVFVPALEALIEKDTEGLLTLVDKKHLLASDMVPSDLVKLTKGKSYTLSRDGFSLRSSAEASLERMATDARKEGITILVSSTYRSWEYQKGLYARNVRELGQEVADRESAPPGASQHQTGTAVDFGTITDSYAQTRAGKWLSSNAWKYGWSLSYPDGYEQVTGYKWECWHYRYIGEEAAAFQRQWFDDVQQYMLEFIHEWKLWRTSNLSVVGLPVVMS